MSQADGKFTAAYEKDNGLGSQGTLGLPWYQNQLLFIKPMSLNVQALQERHSMLLQWPNAHVRDRWTSEDSKRRG